MQEDIKALLEQAINDPASTNFQSLLERAESPDLSTLLSTAIKRNRYEISKIILDKGIVPKKDDYIYATCAGFSSILELIINHPSTENSLEKIIWSEECFLAAIRFHRFYIAKVFVDGGLYVGEIIDQALLDSVASQQYDQVKFCLEHDADIHALDDEPLRNSVLLGNLNLVKLLLENGANVHADNNGAIAFAAQQGHKEIIELLLKEGADPTADDNLALYWAKTNNFPEIEKILISAIENR